MKPATMFPSIVPDMLVVDCGFNHILYMEAAHRITLMLLNASWHWRLPLQHHKVHTDMTDFDWCSKLENW
jgi:hypothetical protein